MDHMDMCFCDDENATVNRRSSGSLSIMKKMSLSLYKMMKSIENLEDPQQHKEGVRLGL